MQEGVSFELLILDDGSKDSTGLRLKAFIGNPKVRIFTSNKIGLAKAVNFLAQKARGNLLYMMGDRIRLSRGTLASLAGTFHSLSPQCNPGAVGPQLLGSRSSVAPTGVAKIGPLTGEMYHDFGRITHEVVQVPFLHSYSLISRSAFLQSGGWDLVYQKPYWRVETDFYLRLLKLGYTLWFDPTCQVSAVPAASGGSRQPRRSSAILTARNHIIFLFEWQKYSCILPYVVMLTVDPYRRLLKLPI